uniref:Uncharacterized protein n=1 Tax=Hucho hucho TaxID=62062 RepID=A0A4W5NC30_9TELE
METFVFTLRLQQLRCSALVLRLQTHHPRKRTVAECVLSLRQLGSEETQHWMELSPPSKTTVCHAELHLATCFQPVNGRIQLQVLAAQNLPAPLSQGSPWLRQPNTGRSRAVEGQRGSPREGGGCMAQTQRILTHL